jgi:P27 family predicted phage terminase small subunit
MRGRPPKPTAIKKAEGNPGKRPLNKSEPSAGKKPAKPAYLGAYGSRMWDRMTKQLDKMGVLDAADQNSIMLWCLAYDDMRENREHIKNHGGTFKVVDQQGNEIVREHPAAKGARDAWKAMRGMLSEFGFTPAARARLGSSKEAPDELSSLLGEMAKASKRN